MSNDTASASCSLAASSPTAGRRQPSRGASARRAALVAAITAAVLVLSSCTPILMVGDSITASSAQPTADELTSQSWAPSVDGVIGRTTDQGLQVIRARRGDSRHFIVELGYNDAGDPNLYRSRLWAILVELQGADRVWVVNLNESRSYYATANRTIDEMRFWFPNMRVIDWASVARSTPGLVKSDGVHLTPAGTVRFAQVVGAAVGSPG